MKFQLFCSSTICFFYAHNLVVLQSFLGKLESKNLDFQDINLYGSQHDKL